MSELRLLLEKKSCNVRMFTKRVGEVSNVNDPSLDALSRDEGGWSICRQCWSHCKSAQCNYSRLWSDPSNLAKWVTEENVISHM